MKNCRELLVLVLMMCCSSLGMCEDEGVPVAPSTYELYSWQAEGGDWNFAIFTSKRSSLLPLESVVASEMKISGIEALKNKLSEFPAESKILWCLSKGVISGDDNGIIKYPKKDIVDDIIKYGKSKGLEISK